MSEVTTNEQGQEENNGTVLESSEDSCDFSKKTDSKSDLEATTSEQREGETTALEYVANVDVTVKSGDCEDDSSSNAGSEGLKDREKEINEDTSNGDEKGEEEEDDTGEDDEDVYTIDGEETVTCALLGFEQAKVFIVKGEENLHVMFQAVKGNVQDTAVKLKGNMHDAAGKMQDNMHEAAERVQEMLKSTKENMTDAAERVHVILKTAKDNVSESMHDAADKAERISKKAIELARSGWYLLSHFELPEWLRDNDFLSHHHRPPMPSFRSCFKSIFKIHSETGNIWTHLIGFVAFICVMLYFFLRPITTSNPFPNDWQEKLVFGAFFAGAILCLGFSWVFHTVYCHSVMVSKVFSRLDYSGIALLIMGSFVPPLYYGFYCSRVLKISYMSVICSLGVMCIIVSLWSKFNTPKYRILRAGKEKKVTSLKC